MDSMCYNQKKYKLQDRHWNAEKPSATLDPWIPTSINHFASQSQTCEPFCIFLHWKRIVKIGQSQVELMRINFKFEAPILQVHIITDAKRKPPCIGGMELVSLSCNRVFISAESVGRGWCKIAIATKWYQFHTTDKCGFLFMPWITDQLYICAIHKTSK